MNQEEWVENTLKEAEEQEISTSGIQTPTPQERKATGVQDDKGKEPEKEIGSKRTREDQTDMDIDSSTKEFKNEIQEESQDQHGP